MQAEEAFDQKILLKHSALTKHSSYTFKHNEWLDSQTCLDMEAAWEIRSVYSGWRQRHGEHLQVTPLCMSTNIERRQMEIAAAAEASWPQGLQVSSMYHHSTEVT